MNPPAPSLCVDPDQAVYVLSDALDLVGVDDLLHGKRVAYMALECARPLGLGAAERTDLRRAALIHDCGVSSTRVHHHLVNELEWAQVEVHCRTGAHLLAGCAPLAHLTTAIYHHHTHWADLRRLAVAPWDATLANLIFLVDRVDALRAQHLAEPDVAGRVRGIIADHAGEFFDPSLVEHFLAASADAAFWQGLEEEAIAGYFRTTLQGGNGSELSAAHLHQLAGLFAHVVDAKSPYTARHSFGVARLTRRLAERLGLAPERIETVEVAALLHDLGKLRVPDEILDKPAPLDGDERQLIRRHALDSHRILARIDGFRAIAEWAGLHHETPAGDGYPFGRSGSALPLEARVIAVADVFQALAQERPYRAALPPETILATLREQAALGHLDRALVELVAEDLTGYWQAAVAVPQPGDERWPWRGEEPA